MNNYEKDLMQFNKDLESKKRFKLLKDLPGSKIGTIFQQHHGNPMNVVPEEININGGVMWKHLTFNLYQLEDDFKDFFKPI